MIAWTNQEELQQAMSEISKGYGEVSYGSPQIGRTPHNINDITIRGGSNRSDYNYYRPHEKIPIKVEDSIKICDDVYKNISIVRSVIDMMSDFTVQGIRIEHRNPSIQNFLNDWAKFVDFEGVSERIANYLYRIANCPVKITYGKVPSKVEQEWKRSSADAKIELPKAQNKRIPLRYNVIHPLNLEVIGGDLAAFIGKPVYGLKVSNSIKIDIEKLQQIKNDLSGDLLKFLPNKLKEKILAGHSIIPIESEKLEVLFYKKDDWSTWSFPMIHAILGAIFLLEKMHLADQKALDGAISQIRLWKLGSFEHKIYPSAAAINKLRDILANIGSGQVMDVIWGPELDFKESDSNSHNFLKSDKYQQVMSEIYAGLGVPPSLTGVASGGQAFGNNSISMKALVERLEYGRRILIRFWEHQLKLIQKAFKWKSPAKISFDYKVLSDEHAERKILIDLWDRDVISTEKLRQLCRQDPTLEKLRVRKEKKQIDIGKLPEKASPYHRTGFENDLKKIILQSGGVAPSELGIDLKPKKSGDKTLNERKDLENQEKPKGEPGEGRPLLSKDKEPRTRNEKPRQSVGFIDLFNWANDTQEEINDIIVPFIKEHYNKKNIRSLTKAEMETFEDIKFNILCNTKPYKSIGEVGEIDNDLLTYKLTLIELFKNKNDRNPTIKELRQIQSSAYAIKYEGENNGTI